MTDAGRPTLYRPDYCELARNYCLLGATNADLAGFFDVTSRTIDNWIAAHPEFAAAVREARAVAAMPGWRAVSTSARWATSTRSSAPSGISARPERLPIRCGSRPIRGPASSGCAIASLNTGASAPRRPRPIRLTCWPCSMPPVSGRGQSGQTLVRDMFLFRVAELCQSSGSVGRPLSGSGTPLNVSRFLLITAAAAAFH